jgi:hypothetical protein
MRSRPLHQWDLDAAYSRKDLASELIGRVGDAAFALAGRCGGVVIDEFGFPVNSPHDLLPR